MHLTDEELIDWLRLIRTENIGPRTFHALLDQFGTASAALEALPELARRGGRLFAGIFSRSDAEKELIQARKLGVRFFTMSEPDYPEPLRAIDTAPPLIAVAGDIRSLSRPMIAIVGSRNASAAGLRMTEFLARGLGEAGFMVVSGLARGIDTKAHQAALPTGTVAVLAGGQARIYPSQNVPLAREIVEQGGAVVSEMPINWEPRAQDFPRRNRIVSGLSRGVLVVEAARRSGSLITARLALEQGRDVFAVPGSPLDPRSEGTNELIRQGAILCSEAAHIAEVIEPSLEYAGDNTGSRTGTFEKIPDENRDMPVSPGNSEAAGVISLLGPVPVHVDELVRLSGAAYRTVQIILLELEIGGRLERHGGNRVSLRA